MSTQPQTALGTLVLQRMNAVGRALDLIHQIGIAAIAGDAGELIDLKLSYQLTMNTIELLSEQIVAAKKELRQ